MVVRPSQPTGVPVQPEEFRTAVESMRSVVLRPEVQVSEMRAPQRIAPYSFALSAEVVPGDEEAATGRLILLHDPEGNEAWHGTFRCVAYARAEADPEQLADGVFAGVAWSWLIDALQAHDLQATALSGTVTTVVSESFGSMVGEESAPQIEIRASWTPLLDDRHPMSAHVEAWGELLCTASGLEPLPEGVAAIPARRPRDR